MLDEEKLRKALRTYFKRVAEKIREVDSLFDELREQVPVTDEDTPRAMEILFEVVEESDLPDRYKSVVKAVAAFTLKKTPYIA